MRKILFFAMMLVAGVMAFTGCKKDKDKEPELKGTVYHYRGTSYVDFEYEHDLYIALEDNHKMTMKWEGVKVTKDAEPVTLYLYNGEWEGDVKNGYGFHLEGKPQLPDGKPFDKWETFDIDGGCDATMCSFDYHVDGGTMGIFEGKIVK